MDQTKDWWDVSLVIAKVASLVAVPIAIGVAGWLVKLAIAEKTVNKDYVTLAVDILQPNDDFKSTEELRIWAVDVLEETGPVSVSPGLREKLIKGEAYLPVSGTAKLQAGPASSHGSGTVKN
ncbi:hypothetical protein QQM79_19630 [Marinobacteraceae bacterium S3BR75-40.1]